jgi:PKD repeat protein
MIRRATRAALACGIAAAAVLAPSAQAAPTAGWNTNPANPVAGGTVTFESTSSDVPPRTITGHEWALDADGAFNDGTGASVSRAYPNAGTFPVSLRVTNDLGEQTVATGQVVVAQPPNRLPTASMTISPVSPVPGQTVTFTSTSADPDGSIVSTEWDLDNNGVYNDAVGTTATRTFPAGGSYVVGLRVTDNRGGVATTLGGVTVNSRPAASFSFVPEQPVIGDLVVFSSTSSDPDGVIVTTEWDLDNDGLYDDGTGATAQRTFTAAGPAVVGLRVIDDRGTAATTRVTLTVFANRPPSAAFTYTPAGPVTGTAITFTSTSTDSDGAIVGHDWDLDGDGAFDDARGPSVRHAFTAAGPHVVSLRVLDDRGNIDVAFQTVNVGTPPPPPAAAQAAPQAGPPAVTAATGRTPARTQTFQTLSPFPIIHYRGRLVPGGARLDLFEVVQIARGALVELACRGRGCPFRRVRARPSAGGRRVRFRQVERRLRAGIVLQVRVTHPTRIGKYASFRIRKTKAPLRRDRCLVPGRTAPKRCT